jgi:hypothetical protein
LVPSLLIDQAILGQEMDPHVSTLDLDIALSLPVFDDEHYRTISERLRSAGFEPDTNEQGNARINVGKSKAMSNSLLIS